MHRALISTAIGAAAGVAAIVGGAAHASAAPVGTDVMPGQAAYVVAPGDTYWSVAGRYGVTMADLAAWNHVSLDEPLDSGWTLQIPPAAWHAPLGAQVPVTAAAPGRSTTLSHTTRWTPVRSTATASGIWGCIAAHESGSNPAASTGNGYYGMYQFTLGTWRAAGGTGNPAAASAAEQTSIAQRVLAQQGWSAWPVTSRLCGA